MIDIIIPTYNNSKSIVDTLNSILNQTIIDKINVYIIDDCSTEDYNDVYNNFSDKLNLKMFKLEQNSGPGIARQYGIDHSNGDYIVFIDSDDEFYDKYSVEKLYNNINNYDMVEGKIYYEYFNEYSHHDGCLHGKMYRRSFLEKNNIRFNNLRSHEDHAFNKICLSIAKVNYIEDIIYKYNYNDKSITSNEDNIDSLKNYIIGMNYVFKTINNIDNINIDNVSFFIYEIMVYIYRNYVENPEGFNFIFKDLLFLKEMYDKYIKYISNEDKDNVWNSFIGDNTFDISFDEFLEKIKKES